MPAAYASVLYKQYFEYPTEYVLTFMGTKLTEPEMVYYSLQRDPIIATYGNNEVVTTQGYAEYIQQLLPCIDCLTATLSLDFVVGHSLGGAAATLYSILKPGGYDLVTFGAPPMYPKNLDGLAYKWDMDAEDPTAAS